MKIRRKRKKKVFISAIVLSFIIVSIGIHIHKHKKNNVRPTHHIGVVFGAAIKGSGKLFGAILYRTQTAVYLYKKDIIKKIVFSGSDIGYRNIGEASAMRIYARKHGVPEKDIFVDHQGHNTYRTIANTKQIIRSHPDLAPYGRSTLFISQDYHLARIQLLARRHGFLGYTYASHDTYPLVKQNQFFLREIFAYIHNFIMYWPSSHQWDQ